MIPETKNEFIQLFYVTPQVLGYWLGSAEITCLIDR